MAVFLKSHIRRPAINNTFEGSKIFVFERAPRRAPAVALDPRGRRARRALARQCGLRVPYILPRRKIALRYIAWSTSNLQGNHLHTTEPKY